MGVVPSACAFFSSAIRSTVALPRSPLVATGAILSVQRGKSLMLAAVHMSRTFIRYEGGALHLRKKPLAACHGGANRSDYGATSSM